MKFLAETATAFSGNPQRITIFGESAGAGSVSDHLVAPRSWGLFQGAIMESSGASDWCAQPLNTSMSRWPQLAAHASCSAGTGAQQLACLRSLNYSQILNFAHGLHSAFQEWSPVIDGVELTDDPRKLMAAGKFSNVPVLIGANKDEGTIFNPAPLDLNETGFVTLVNEAFNGTNMSGPILSMYPVSDFHEHDHRASASWWALTQIFTDSQVMIPPLHPATTTTTPPMYLSLVQMLCPSHQAAGWMTSGGNPHAFVYYYTHVLWAIEHLVDYFKPLECSHARYENARNFVRERVCVCVCACAPC
jgi:carboxylesterase type B